MFSFPLTAAARRMGGVGVLVASFVLTSCAAGIPKDALTLSPESMALRQLQTKRFETADEKKLLIGAASILQDLGFTIDESESQLGVVVGSKERDATEAGQVAGAVIMAILFGVATPVDREQRIRASIVTRPVSEGNTTVRVTFQRVVWNDRGQVSKTESLEDPKLYQEFFDKFAKAVFLNANDI
jgi:hypothetical protein